MQEISINKFVYAEDTHGDAEVFGSFDLPEGESFREETGVGRVEFFYYRKVLRVKLYRETGNPVHLVLSRNFYGEATSNSGAWFLNVWDCLATWAWLKES